MEPFCYVLEETDWGYFDINVFPCKISISKYLQKELGKANKEALAHFRCYSVLPNEERTVANINIKDFLND